MTRIIPGDESLAVMVLSEYAPGDEERSNNMFKAKVVAAGKGWFNRGENTHDPLLYKAGDTVITRIWGLEENSVRIDGFDFDVVFVTEREVIARIEEDSDNA